MLRGVQWKEQGKTDIYYVEHETDIPMRLHTGLSWRSAPTRGASWYLTLGKAREACPLPHAWHLVCR